MIESPTAKVTRRGHRQGSIDAESCRHRLRRVEPTDRRDGRRHHPAHAAPCTKWSTSAPSTSWPRPTPRTRLPDRPRHGHVLLRAPVGRIDGGGFLRPSADLPPPRRHPVERRSGTVADRAPAHRGRLLSADGTGHRADGHARRRRDQVRHQRAAVAHARRHARSSARPSRSRNLWSARRCGSRKDPASPRLVAEWMTYGYPHLCDPHGIRHRPVLPARDGANTTSTPGAPSTSTRPTASCHPREQWASERGMNQSPMYLRQRGSRAPCSSTPVDGNDRSGTSRMPRSSSATGSRAESTSGTLAGGHRSSTPSTSTCVITSAWSISRPSRSTSCPVPAPSISCSSSRSTSATSPSAGRSTPRS